jgi:hypothetical protein
MECTIVLLGMFTMTAEVFIQPGFGDDPGQMHMKFVFEWSIAAAMKPFVVTGEIDMVPFNFNLDITKMADTTVYLGLVIRPDVFNDIIRDATEFVKKALWLVIFPMVLIVVFVCRAKYNTKKSSPCFESLLFETLYGFT